MTPRLGLLVLVMAAAGCGPPQQAGNTASAEAPANTAVALSAGGDSLGPSAGEPVEGWHEPTLCEAGENVAWSCIAGARTISVCASRVLTADQGYIQYRAGRRGQIELAYPAERVHPRGLFKYEVYPQGDTALSFANGGYDYTVVEDLRSDEDLVLVAKGGAEASRIVCNGGGAGIEIRGADLLGIAP